MYTYIYKCVSVCVCVRVRICMYFRLGLMAVNDKIITSLYIAYSSVN